MMKYDYEILYTPNLRDAYFDGNGGTVVRMDTGRTEAKNVIGALDLLFRKYNHVDENDTFRFRSMSVGDVVKLSDEALNDEYYECKPFGWEKIPAPQKTVIPDGDPHTVLTGMAAELYRGKR